MKRIKNRTLVVVLLGFLISVFSSFTINAEEQGIVRIGGSTTLLPIIATCAMNFMDKYSTWDQVDPAFPKSQVLLFVTGGGSGFGVKALMNDTVHIGLISRDLKESEKSQLGNFQTILVGKDALAIAANKNTPLKRKNNFTTEEVANIFSGGAKTFKDVVSTAPKKEIILLVRDAGAGSAEIFQEKVMGKAQVSPRALQMPSQGALLQKLEAKNESIAYISSGLVSQNQKLVAFDLDGVAPTNQNVINGTYKLSRPLYMVIKGTPNPLMKAFINYVLTEGQKIVAELAYVPVNAVQK